MVYLGIHIEQIINKHFPKGSQLSKIFNRNTVKVSYSCMPNLASIIKSHNKKVSTSKEEPQRRMCNCPRRKKATCPLEGKCLTSSIVYSAEVTTYGSKDNGKLYIGLTEGPFKKRYYNHMQSIKKKKHRHDTELSTYIWKLKRKKKRFSIKWSIVTKSRAYSNKTKKCDLCISEKLAIVNADKRILLNSRSELVSKCRHENKFYLTNCSVT